MGSGAWVVAAGAGCSSEAGKPWVDSMAGGTISNPEDCIDGFDMVCTSRETCLQTNGELGLAVLSPSPWPYWTALAPIRAAAGQRMPIREWYQSARRATSTSRRALLTACLAASRPPGREAREAGRLLRATDRRRAGIG